MKKLLKFFLYGGATIVLAVVIFIIYFNSTHPKVEPPKNVSVEATPERPARGEYLANHITVCMDCHSTRDWSKFAVPIVPGTLGKGGELFNEDLSGVPGTLHAKNITPAGTVRSMNITPDEETGIGTWSLDDFIARFKNFDPDSSEFIPAAKDEFNTPMPWIMYAGMTTEDLEAIYTYLKSVEPINHRVERFTEAGAGFRK